MYSNCCWSCSFEPEINETGQSCHKMYSNNRKNSQESTTILNASTKKVWKLLKALRIYFPLFLSFCNVHIFISLCLSLSLSQYKHTHIYTNTHTHTHTHIYSEKKVKLAIIVEGDSKAPFSIATTPRCREGRYSFLWMVYFTLDPYLIMLIFKQGGIKNHFLSLWYDSTWDLTQVFRALDEHANR